MRVLHVHSGNLYGGVETLLVTLARCRDLCPWMTPEFALCFNGRLSEELANARATVHPLGSVRMRHPLTVYRARRTLRQLIRDGQFDLVVCHMIWAHVMFTKAAQEAGVPAVVWLHDAFDGAHWLSRWAGRQAPDSVIANSQFTANTWKGVMPPVPVQVMFYPVTAPPLSPDLDRQRIRRELNTPDNATVIIQVSRMQEWKGHVYLLEALKALSGRENWVCWIVGGAQRQAELRYEHTLKSRALALGLCDRIRFAGERRDVGDLLASADIFCQYNLRPEPFGITLIEALYSGLPVVTAGFGGAVEVVSEGFGILAAPNDPRGLSEALGSLLEDRDRVERLRCAARVRAVGLCDPMTQMRRLGQTLAGAVSRVTSAEEARLA